MTRDDEAWYFSPCSFEKASEASKYLALPYEPICEFAVCSKQMPPHVTWHWEPSRNRNRCEHFPGVRRVWAAFGKPGGGWEFMASGDIGHPAYRALEDGGHEDEYYGTMPPTRHEAVVRDVMRGTALYFVSTVFQIEKLDKIRILLKIVGPSAVVIYSRPVHESYELTISMSYNETKGIRIWGVSWRDSNSKRELSPVISITHPNKKISYERLRNTALYFCGNPITIKYDDILLGQLKLMYSMATEKRETAFLNPPPKFQRRSRNESELVEYLKEWENYNKRSGWESDLWEYPSGWEEYSQSNLESRK